MKVNYRKGWKHHINFRCSDEQYQQLMEICSIYGTDVSGIMRMLVAESLPELYTRAAKLKQRAQEAKEKLKK